MTNLTRRTFMAALSSSAALLTGSTALSTAAWAQAGNWPQGKSLKIVVPFAPAGTTDIIARLIADRLSQSWGNQVVVENKSGAGGNIGVESVAKSEPDGATMLVASVGMVTNPHLFAQVNYDPFKDFTPVTLLAMVPNIMVIGNHLPFKTVAEFVAYGKANPGKLTYGSSGTGTSIHLAGELFKKLTGIDMVHVPYRGSGPALQDLMAGRFDVMFDNITSALPQVQAGTMKALGITTAKRSPFVPDLPPINDTVPGFDVSSWFALFVPAKTPSAVVDKIRSDAILGLKDPGLKAKLDAQAAEIVGNDGPTFAAFLKVENEKWGKLIKEGGIKAGG